MLFEDPIAYDSIEMGDELEIEGLLDQIPTRRVCVKNVTRHFEFNVVLDLSDAEWRSCSPAASFACSKPSWPRGCQVAVLDCPVPGPFMKNQAVEKPLPAETSSCPCAYS